MPPARLAAPASLPVLHRPGQDRVQRSHKSGCPHPPPLPQIHTTDLEFRGSVSMPPVLGIPSLIRTPTEAFKWTGEVRPRGSPWTQETRVKDQPASGRSPTAPAPAFRRPCPGHSSRCTVLLSAPASATVGPVNGRPHPPHTHTPPPAPAAPAQPAAAGRRDGRLGRTLGHVETTSDPQRFHVKCTWSDPHAGHNTDTYLLSPDGQELRLHQRVTVGDQASRGGGGGGGWQAAGRAGRGLHLHTCGGPAGQRAAHMPMGI